MIKKLQQVPDLTEEQEREYRDWYAGQALIGIIRNWRTVIEPSEIATQSFAIAEAMMKERKLRRME